MLKNINSINFWIFILENFLTLIKFYLSVIVLFTIFFWELNGMSSAGSLSSWRKFIRAKRLR